MNFLINWVYLLSLSVWLGGIVFFSFFTTPAAFISLPKEMASGFLATIFPRYYQLGYWAGGIMLVSSLAEHFLIKPVAWLRFVFILLMLASTCYAGLVLRPQIHDLKVQMKSVEEGTEIAKQMKQRFDHLHRSSVLLNIVVLVAGLFLLGIMAMKLRL